MSVTVLDVKGLNCPLPVLRTKKAMKDVPAGGTLQVMTTDPGSVKDFQAFCEQTGNQLENWSEADGVFTFLIKKN
ncbi:sulfurtransferase TusA family protein [Telmatospirillum sp. J64-1]|uniref:sulfurtransferase TusA family protein n=1 Tax=Telmatospirillum sp. J64-1 TaxID=2502183 RepID=UPI00115E4398|nr:sulfurtransferase TusA family protein [Telmatospirillum sp. J64-1]